MTLAAPKLAVRKTAVAAITLAAAAGSIALTAPAAVASSAPATTHCSTWKHAGTTKYELRECAQWVKYATGPHVKVTVYLKNTGSNRYVVTGTVGVGWGQAGNGTAFKGVRVAPHTAKTITRAFDVPAHGDYTPGAQITVNHRTATVHSAFSR